MKVKYKNNVQFVNRLNNKHYFPLDKINALFVLLNINNKIYY